MKNYKLITLTILDYYFVIHVLKEYYQTVLNSIYFVTIVLLS